jgi:transposase-like protein
VETVNRIVAMREKGRTVSAIARELDISPTTVGKYLKEFSRTDVDGGVPPCAPGEVINSLDVDGTVTMVTLDRPKTESEIRKIAGVGDEWICEYDKVKNWQSFYKIGDGRAGHRKVEMWGTQFVFKRIVDFAIQDAIQEFVRRNVKPLAKRDLPQAIKKRGNGPPQCLSWGLWDTHLGAYAWNHEVGADWDINLATNRIFNSIDDMMLELNRYPIKKIWMPIGNDFLHFDSVRYKTAGGEHHLDTDTRFAKVYLQGLECLAYMVERALQLGVEEIELIHVPGNHDTTSAFTLCVCLAQRFLHDDRVTTDLRPLPRKFKMFGGSLVGFSHGEKAAPTRLNTIFSTETIAMFSRSTYREMQVGHKHQRNEIKFPGVDPTNGLLVRVNPCLCNIDKWHYDHGFISEPVKSVEAWRYDETGYRGSHVAWARDEKNSRVGTLKLCNKGS